MGIYRAEQARLSFASEAGRSGYMEQATATHGNNTTLSKAHSPGTREIAVASTSAFASGDYVVIGDTTPEIRKVIRKENNNLYINYPIGFHHANGQSVDKATLSTGGSPGLLQSTTGRNYMTFFPGVYETINTPDFVPEFTPHYIVSNQNDRNFSIMYPGKQTYQGSLPNFILLNGYPIKYPIGIITTVGKDTGSGGGSTLSAASSKGAQTVALTDATGYAAGDMIQIGETSSAEVRRVISSASNVLTLNYPLMLEHASGSACNEVTTPFTHTIHERARLETMTWNVLMVDSDETVDNNFIRRYIGGIVNRATISAEEGGMLMMAWDDVLFQDLVHNQLFSSNVNSGNTEITKASQGLLLPGDTTTNTAANKGTTYGNIGGDFGSSWAAPAYPTTEPYYFSEGNIKFFGTTFARVRNFRIDINNNIEPRYYVKEQSSSRGPAEFLEQRREYQMTAAVALEDSKSYRDKTSTARNLWKELILESNYGNGFAGWDMELVFRRKNSEDDKITFTLPQHRSSGGGGTSATLNKQGIFVTRAPHNIGTESPIQVDLEMKFRSLGIEIKDSVGVYP